MHVSLALPGFEPSASLAIATVGRTSKEEFVVAARRFVLTHLRRHGPTSGEDLTDAMAAGGLRHPASDKGVGGVYASMRHARLDRGLRGRNQAQGIAVMSTVLPVRVLDRQVDALVHPSLALHLGVRMRLFRRGEGVDLAIGPGERLAAARRRLDLERGPVVTVGSRYDADEDPVSAVQDVGHVMGSRWSRAEVCAARRRGRHA